MNVDEILEQVQNKEMTYAEGFEKAKNQDLTDDDETDLIKRIWAEARRESRKMDMALVESTTEISLEELVEKYELGEENHK